MLQSFFIFFLTRPYYFLYLFQLENYNSRRFFRLSLTRLTHAAARRESVVWTYKAHLLFFLAVILSLAALFLIAFLTFFLSRLLSLSLFLALVTALLSLWLFFLYFIISNWLLAPLDWLAKSWLLFRARRHLSRFPRLIVIAITGSYGKTTTKTMLAAALSAKFKVLATPENINTPLGIARLLLSRLNDQIDILLVEMGAYQRGDVAALCRLTPPDISILTGINESHLERFGTLADTIAAKFEIVTEAKPNALIVLNTRDERVLNHYDRYLGGRPVVFTTDCQPVNISFLPDGRGQSFALKFRHHSLGPLTLPHLAGYAPATAALCALVAEHLKLTPAEIKTGLTRAEPAPHRLAATLHPNNVLVIDDSYNGNPDGFREAVRVLAQFPARRKIFVTPGLVELGDQSGQIHYELGRALAAVADQVFLIDTSASESLRRGLLAAGFNLEAVRLFSSMSALAETLPALLKSGDVILFQNDWPDNYA